MERVPGVVGAVLMLQCGVFSPAQQTVATATNGIVPPLVTFSGMLTDLNGKPLTGVVGVTFCLYKDQQGGSPVWLETQNVHPDSRGHYTVLLGSTSSDGLPTSIFTSGEAHWLGVQVQGDQEQPRVLLVSAPYALKAGDAETLGGFPPSAFVLAAPPSRGGLSPATAVASMTGSVTPSSRGITSTGTANLVPLWDTTSDLESSVLFQSGAGSTAKIGINTASPASTLDVQGAGTIRGMLSLPASGAATVAEGAHSQPLALAASAFSSTTSAAVNQTFLWQAEPAGNGTSSPSGTLNLLFGEGVTKPSETGLQIAGNGQIKFAAGQTFPGAGNGAITAVVAGTDLTGGGTSGSVTLNLNTSATDARYARLGAKNTLTGAQTIKATETITATSSSQTLNVTQSGTQATGDAIHGITDSTGGTGVFGEGAIGIQGLASTSLGLAALFRGTVKITGDGNNLMAGDPGCGPGYAGLGAPTSGALSGCTNYALLGGPKGDTYVNSSGTAWIHFRSNNNELATIGNKGNVKIIGQNGGGNLNVAGNLTVAGPYNTGPGGKFTGFSAPSGSGLGGRDGINAAGGNADPNTSPSSGGTGVVGTGGTGIYKSPYGGDGPGGAFFGGKSTNFGDGVDAFAGSGAAGYFGGDIDVSGTVYAGKKDFKIDHPLDPANKYLLHTSVESSEMMNIYTSNVTTDSQGQATVRLPEWLEVLNTDFRYQLTVIGQFAQAIVASEFNHNQFSIRTDKPNVKVSWQVTGVRQDAYAKTNPMVVEQEKEPGLRGFYIHPELYGAPPEKQIQWARHPRLMREMEEMRATARPATKVAAQPHAISK